MSQSTQNKLSNKVLEKTISASIKKEIAAASIGTTTRKGNKELKFLTSKIAKYPFNDLEQARIAGAKLGQHIAEIFQQRGKKNLDGGIIQQIYFQKELFSLAGLSDPEPASNETSPPETVTSTNLEQPTEEAEANTAESTPEVQPDEESSPNDAPALTTAEAEANTAEPTPEVQPDEESSPNDAPALTTEEAEANTAEPTSEVQSDEESSPNEENSSQEVSETTKPAE
ncbi:MAG: hypothetical protein QNJ72_36040 [Pleurocapsa sp. MO_226.B13]|nr:hypothetical protein [Pleurocapsa sp. MO_226.B13]